MTRCLRAFPVFSLLILSAVSSEAAKRVHLDTLDTDIVIQARIRHATVIVLPDSEQILDFVAGDSETWAVSGAVNVAYVKPGEEGARTNIALICASGNIYSFRVHEDSGGEPDLVVYVDYAAAAPSQEESRSKRPTPHEPKWSDPVSVDTRRYWIGSREVPEGAGRKEAPGDEQVCEALSEGVPGAGREAGTGRQPRSG